MNNFFDVMDSMYSWKKRQGIPVIRPAPEYVFAYEPLNQGFRGFLRTFNYEERLHEITCKTLILVGEEDWITDKIHSEFMAGKIPDNHFIVFPHADHSMESDVPEAFFSSIHTFIKSQCEERNSHYFFKDNDNTGKVKFDLTVDESNNSFQLS
ncbi:alpha/beta fold hydrolase [Legionella hackeliae]|uniref:Uncharacterized protein n=1 Tax=Legionella hackeliae TaxID=449 RepID=A0A0A8UK55_LEGHA|nr:alpha/beta hydrolase [Legionella hackeliae]KTD12930.1 putative aminoacrylate hydrolase RutD [Legionella hackeliae]CEK09240.1 protein of unknown function [Alpha/beta hydrolase fold-1] [Legionella hackeliae]STX49147.1 proline-specific peptidase [Legionella hackeliae]